MKVKLFDQGTTGAFDGSKLAPARHSPIASQ